MHTCKPLLLTSLACAAICLFSGCSTTTGEPADSPLERAVEQPLEDAADSVGDDYRRADEQHEDIIDKAFAPLDDTVEAINRDLNREPEDSAASPSGDGD